MSSSTGKGHERFDPLLLNIAQQTTGGSESGVE
jgi:hypothetical protein